MLKEYGMDEEEEESLTPKELKEQFKGVNEQLDINGDGRFDEEDLDILRKWYINPQHAEPEPETEDDEPEHFEPEDDEPEDVEPPTMHTTRPIVQTAPPTHVASPIVRVAPTTTACATCPHPKVHNPNWDKLALLNDTRKNINGFKLFAELTAPPSEAFPLRFAVHVREHEDRKDIWNVKMFPEVEDEMDKEIQSLAKLKENATSQQKAVLDELKSFNSYQPRWNLADNRLETRSNNSAPVNDALYFRLFEDQRDSKDTSQYHGSAYRSMLTTNSNKGSYNKEHNAKLIGKKSWQLKRDSDAPWHYTLINEDMPGNFFWCLDQGKMSAVEEKVKNMMESSEEEDVESGMVEVLQALGDHEGAELMYMTSNETAVQLTTGKINCRAVTLKVR